MPLPRAVMTTGVSVVWFRRDLRLHDLPALNEALRQSEAVVPLFVLDPRLLGHGAEKRSGFLLSSLRTLAGSLEERGAPLIIRSGRPEIEVPRVASEVSAHRVFASREYTAFGRKRDDEVAQGLAKLGARLVVRDGVLVTEPEQIRSKSGDPFVRFAPFRKRWLAHACAETLASPAVIPSAVVDRGEPIPSTPTPPAGCPEPGESAARRRMARWVESGVAHYGDLRDRLDTEGTSRLSQDLRWGLISPRELRSAVNPEAGEAFLSELAWRDFAYHVASHRGRDRGTRFARRPLSIEWRNDPHEIAAWKAGLTGYPIIDAAMRQLRLTGFMPNRARMLTASFLTKHLLCDWRIGEGHFMEHLVDGDPAINRYNWEWVASVGVDAQPAFRIFNPTMQANRFDRDGEYTRRWVPELAGLRGPAIHEPWRLDLDASEAAKLRLGVNYPVPLVDHAYARARALAAFTRAG